MHGIVLSALKDFVEEQAGAEAWNHLLAEANLTGKAYRPIQEYPDDEAADLFAAASRKTSLPLDSLLEAFGEFLTPTLMRLYGHLARPEWRCLEFIEHAEHAIHKVVRVNISGARPPVLAVSRLGPNEISVDYSSHRKMCGLAKGIVRGVARHYRETIDLQEHACMNRGDPACRIAVRLLPPTVGGKSQP